MQKVEKAKILKIAAVLFDIIALGFFLLYMYWIFAVADMDKHPLTTLFIKVNPMTIGAYCLGAATLVHFLTFKNPVGRCVVCIPYLFSVAVSFVAVMGMTGWSNLLMYVPHIIIILIVLMISSDIVFG